MEPGTTPSPATTGSWRQRTWDELLARIEDRQVVPIVGPDLVMVERAGTALPLERYVALELAAQLDLPQRAGPEASLNEVMCTYFENLPPGETRTTPYTLIPEILRQARFTPPAALRQLAEITDFTLFVTTTFDTLLADALNAVRFNGEKGTSSIVYRYNKREDLACTVAELRERGQPTVYHLLGQVSSSPTYVLTEEDLLEFLYALQSAEYRPKNLLAELAEHHLLVIGEHFSDWLARLFLRTTKGRKLSQYQDFTEILADSRTSRETALVTFLSHFSTHTRIFPGGGAVEFVSELHRRWRERHPAAATPAKTPFVPPPREIPKQAVFLSYAREDLEAVKRLKSLLEKAGISVWFDMEQIKGGQDWERRIAENVRSCALFIPVMSRHTAAQTRDAYFRVEWNGAIERTQRMKSGEVFITPIVVDQLSRQEAAGEFPDNLKLHIERAEAGELAAEALAHLTEEYARITGITRGDGR
jgi:TIR domain-containing protein/SIR2-like protein